MAITAKVVGGSNKGSTTKWLQKMQRLNYAGVFARYGQMGVSALSAATPVESGETAGSWYYEVEIKPGLASIIWKNRHVDDGRNVAILLQYGHGTGTGGYVQGRDFINPAMRPIFDQIEIAFMKEVNR
jgi:hypothetical protein